MIHHVQLFAGARELAGTDFVAIDLPEGASVRDLKVQLGRMYPRLERLLARSTIAINDEYADPEQVLPAGASIALIPPVSGGAPLAG